MFEGNTVQKAHRSRCRHAISKFSREMKFDPENPTPSCDRQKRGGIEPGSAHEGQAMKTPTRQPTRWKRSLSSRTPRKNYLMNGSCLTTEANASSVSIGCSPLGKIPRRLTGTLQPQSRTEHTEWTGSTVGYGDKKTDTRRTLRTTMLTRTCVTSQDKKPPIHTKRLPKGPHDAVQMATTSTRGRRVEPRDHFHQKKQIHDAA